MAGAGRPLVLKGVSKPGSAGPRIVSLADADLVQIFASVSRDRLWFVRAAVVIDFLQHIPECIKVNRTTSRWRRSRSWCSTLPWSIPRPDRTLPPPHHLAIRGSLSGVWRPANRVAPVSGAIDEDTNRRYVCTTFASRLHQAPAWFRLIELPGHSHFL